VGSSSFVKIMERKISVTCECPKSVDPISITSMTEAFLGLKPGTLSENPRDDEDEDGSEAYDSACPELHRPASSASEPPRTVSGISDKPLRLETKALFGPFDHGLCCAPTAVIPCSPIARAA
jgi:hypothetical protein